MENVLIDAVRYSIEQTDEMILVDGCVCHGDVNYDQAHIRISNDENVLGEGRKAQVLMHEIIHALLFERGQEEHEDEELTDSLASGFVNLIRQNPELVDFIKK